jgi:hypothetical protein
MEEPLGPLKQRKPSEVEVKHSLKPLKWGQPTWQQQQQQQWQRKVVRGR